MPEKFRAAVAVYGILRSGDGILMLRRAGTGYRDGQLSLPAGHLDGGEDAVSGLVRELREELAVDVNRQACHLALTMHRASESPLDFEYIDLFFDVDRWAGEPVIGEPDKCAELVWLSPSTTGADVVDYVAVALRAITDGKSFVVHGWS